MGTHSLMVRLDDDDHARLETEAGELGMPASTLARVLLHATLTAATAREDAVRDRRLAALDRLAELRAGMPPVDSLRLIRDGRRHLDARTRRSR